MTQKLCLLRCIKMLKKKSVSKTYFKSILNTCVPGILGWVHCWHLFWSTLLGFCGDVKSSVKQDLHGRGVSKGWLMHGHLFIHSRLGSRYQGVSRNCGHRHCVASCTVTVWSPVTKSPVFKEPPSCTGPKIRESSFSFKSCDNEVL